MTTPVDRLIIESCPLHTEEPQWAEHAPAQVEAACKRGAHVIALTETRGPIMAEVKKVVEAHGYRWFGMPVDEHRNVSLLVKRGLHVTGHSAVVVANNWRPSVTFDFKGTPVTVFGMHWEPAAKARTVQTKSLIDALAAVVGLGFYAGDSNPSKPQSASGSQPNTAMSQAGMPVIFEELHKWPDGIGVTVVGRRKHRRVQALSVKTSPALGSDHVPATAVYGVRRRPSGK